MLDDDIQFFADTYDYDEIKKTFEEKYMNN